jgi:hypothetical protein
MLQAGELNPMSTSREYEVMLTPEVEGELSVALPGSTW